MDSAYRYGGDEFTVILPGAPKKEAAQVAERIKKSFKTMPYLQGINLSIGLVEFDPQYDLTAFIQHADEAMYSAKKLGGNQIFIFPGKISKLRPREPASSFFLLSPFSLLLLNPSIPPVKNLGRRSRILQEIV